MSMVVVVLVAVSSLGLLTGAPSVEGSHVPQAAQPLVHSFVDTRCEWHTCTKIRLKDNLNPFNVLNVTPALGSPSRLYWGRDLVWTEGSDGPGTGLEADLLDGLDAAQLVRSDRSGSIAGDLALGGALAARSGAISGNFSVGGTLFTNNLQTDFTTLRTDFLTLPPMPRARLPAAGEPGRVAHLGDDVRGLWMDRGNQWAPLAEALVNVRDFGARGDGLADDTAAIRAAAAVANAGWPQSLDTAAPGGSGRESHPVLYFPYGKYLVSGTIELGAYASVLGEDGATLFAAGPNVTLLDVYSYRNRVEGLRFAGGKHHLVLSGAPSLDTTVVRVSDVEFSLPSDAAIVLDNRRDPTRGFAMNLVVDKFFFEGKRLFRGTADGVSFSHGWATWRPEVDQDAAWQTGGLLKLRDILGVPWVSPEVRPVWVNLTGGYLDADGVRFGGENAGRTIVRTSDGLDGDRVVRSKVSIRNSAMYAGLQYWMLVYDSLPALLEVANPEGLGESWGVFIDRGVNLSKRHDAGLDTVFRFPDVAATKPLHQGSDPRVNEGVDVTGKVRQYLLAPGGWNTLSPLPQANLFIAGTYSPLQGNFLHHSVNNFTYLPDDTSTGYALPVAKAIGASAYWNVESPSWGASMPPGDYVFSFFLKANHSGEVILYFKGPWILKVPYFASDTYEQVYAPFYHDGTPGGFGLGFYNWQNGTTLSFGLFAVHKGDVPAAYTLPGNANGGWMPERYYLAAAPTSGTYKVGDIVWNTAPTGGGNVGWVCVQAGSPGVWKKFGTIEA